MKKDIKPLLAIGLALLVGVVGGTIAYFRTEQTFKNEFKTKPYRTLVTETFESPDNWTPGTTTAKTVIAKNTGDVDIAVRVSYEESWTPANGGTLSLEQAGERAAIINFANQSQWIKNGNYYYYYKKLTKNQSTSSFIESVTFNPNITASLNCTPDPNALVKSCESNGNGYDGATYTLNIKVETIQYDAYQTAWASTVNIGV